MKIIGKIEGQCSSGSDYPCIKATETGRVVLFTGPATGFILVDDGYYKAGHSANSWSEVQFKPLVGSITLKQE